MTNLFHSLLHQGYPTVEPKYYGVTFDLFLNALSSKEILWIQFSLLFGFPASSTDKSPTDYLNQWVRKTIRSVLSVGFVGSGASLLAVCSEFSLSLQQLLASNGSTR